MWFKKSETKKKHPLLAAIAGGVTVAGAIGVFSSVKKFCTDKMRRVALFFKKEKRAMDDTLDL